MTIIPLAITYCSVVELLIQFFALVNGSYGEQHCITSPKFLSIGNNIIPPQLLQRTTMEMLVPNLNLSMLLSQYAETMIPTYEIMQIPLDSDEDLLPSTTACWRDLCGFLTANTTSSGVSNYGAPIIYNWKQAGDTAI